MTASSLHRRTVRRALAAVLLLVCVTPFACCGGVLLAFGPMTTVRHEYRLPPTPAGPLTFRAWSYGTWATAADGWHGTQVEGPPYTLVLAAACDDPTVRAVELAAVDLVLPDGSAESVLGDLVPGGGDPDPAVGELALRPRAAIEEPYAAWQWQDRFPERDPLTVRVRAVLIGGPRDGEAVRVTLKIPLTEERSTGWTFWEMMMSA